MLRPTTAISQMGKLRLPHAAQCHSASWEGQGFKGTSGHSCPAPQPSIPASTIVQGAGTLGPHLALEPGIVSLCFYSPFPSPFVFQRLGVEEGILRNSVQWPDSKGLGLRAAGGPPDYSPNAHLPPAKAKPWTYAWESKTPPPALDTQKSCF